MLEKLDVNLAPISNPNHVGILAKLIKRMCQMHLATNGHHSPQGQQTCPVNATGPNCLLPSPNRKSGCFFFGMLTDYRILELIKESMLFLNQRRGTGIVLVSWHATTRK
jgi:hypothetical protein